IKFASLLPANVRRLSGTRFTMVTPAVDGASVQDFDADWLVVRSPGQGQPGHGATEADPFLTRRDVQAVEQPTAAVGLDEKLHTTSNSSRVTESSGTNLSGYGVL
ncbi:unnamed protein product, partial [Mycena citricolor]